MMPQDYPGYYSGLRGSGASATLDPRFQVSGDVWGTRGIEALERIAAQPRETPHDAFYQSVRDRDRMAGSRLNSSLAALMGAGRGLRDADAARIRSGVESSRPGQIQSLRAMFERMAAADAIQGARSREGLFGSLPGLQAQSAQAANLNANRALSEAQAFQKYKDDAYGMDVKRRMSQDFARAAG